MNHENIIKLIEVEKFMEYDKWQQEIPKIKFDPDWDVQIIPPFGGAVVRFRVDKGDASVSIYLDCYGRLGRYGQPYWEVYPHNGDVFRCDMKDTDNLLKAIRESISEQS